MVLKIMLGDVVDLVHIFVPPCLELFIEHQVKTCQYVKWDRQKRKMLFSWLHLLEICLYFEETFCRRFFSVSTFLIFSFFLNFEFPNNIFRETFLHQTEEMSEPPLSWVWKKVIRQQLFNQLYDNLYSKNVKMQKVDVKKKTKKKTTKRNVKNIYGENEKPSVRRT